MDRGLTADVVDGNGVDCSALRRAARLPKLVRLSTSRKASRFHRTKAVGIAAIAILAAAINAASTGLTCTRDGWYR